MGRGFVHLDQLHVLATDDRDDDALGPRHRHPFEQRVGDRLFGGLAGAAFALGLAGAHHGLAHFLHHGLHVGKVQVDEARHGHEVGDRTHALLQHLIRQAEGFLEGRVAVGDQEQVLVGNDDQRVDMLVQFLDPGFGRTHAARAFEQERLGHDTHGQHALAPRRFRNHGRGAGAGAAAHPGGDEAHVHAFERFLDRLDRFLGRSLAQFGPRAGAQPAGAFRAELDAVFRRRSAERLRIGVGDDKIDALDIGFHHVGDGIPASTADPDYRNTGAQFVGRIGADVDTHKLFTP